MKVCQKHINVSVNSSFVKLSHTLHVSKLIHSRLSVACRTLWPEYEIINEDECVTDENMTVDNGSSLSLVAKSDDSSSAFQSWFDKFEVE